MRKLRLDVEDLRVDTFSTGADGDGQGTVEAFRQRTVTGDPLSCWQSCGPDDTCLGCSESCDGTCDGCGGGGTGTDGGPTQTDPVGGG